MSDSGFNDRTTVFLQLLNAHDRALTLHVYAMVPNTAEAEDILQQTKMLLWKHFDDFELGTNFLAWARKTAFHQVLTFRRKRKREVAGLSDEALEALSLAVGELTDEPTARQEALHSCLGLLPEAHRQMIELRYFKELEIGDLAKQLGRTETAVYRALSRVRMTLMECVSRKVEGLS